VHTGEEDHAHPVWTNINMWTGLPVEESIRLTQYRDKWRKYDMTRVWPTLGLRTAKEQNRAEVRHFGRIPVCDIQTDRLSQSQGHNMYRSSKALRR